MIDDEDPPDEPSLPLDLPTVDVATPKGVRRQISKAKQAQQETDEFWKAVLKDRIGRRTIWGLLQAGHVFETKFACGPNGFPQSEATWYAKGEQDFALRLYHNLLRLDLTGVHLMHSEHDPRFVTPKLRPSTKQEP